MTPEHVAAKAEVTPPERLQPNAKGRREVQFPEGACFNLKRAVETTDEPRCTQIKTSCERRRDHPSTLRSAPPRQTRCPTAATEDGPAQPFYPGKSVLICVHLWFPFF